MVVVGLQGGMGNQMFQYAAGRRLATALGTTLWIDRSAVDTNGTRPYSLQHFRVRARTAAPGLRSRFEAHTTAQRVWRKLRRRRLVREPSARFHPDVLDLRGHVYLWGWWQSARYFADIAGEIRNDMALAVPPSRVTAERAARLPRERSVGVHVRRGDYAHDPRTNQVHGLCSPAYYQAAVREIRQRIADPYFVVFSDDPAWVRAHANWFEPAIVVEPGAGDHEDLWLLSQCSHHIIANSSFSWWGAWLAGRAGQTVIVPDPWFADAGYDGRDIPADGWLRLPR